MTDIYLPESYGDVLVDAPELGPGERLHSCLLYTSDAADE